MGELKIEVKLQDKTLEGVKNIAEREGLELSEVVSQLLTRELDMMEQHQGDKPERVAFAAG